MKSPSANPYSRRFQSVLAALLLVAVAGCSGRPAHVRPAAPAAQRAEGVASTDAKPSSSGTNFGVDDGAPTTPEEKREEKASIQVLDSLPDEEDMSREKMAKLIEDAEKNIPEEPLDQSVVDANPKEVDMSGNPTGVPSSTPLPDPSPVPSTVPVSVPRTSPGLLTDNTALDSKTPVAVKDPVKTPPVKKDPPVHSSTWPVTKPSGRPEVPPVVVEKRIEKPVEKPVEKPMAKTPTKKPTDQWPVKKPDPKPVPSSVPSSTPTIDPNEDNGIDPDDAKYDQTYSGPKKVVDHPRSSPDFQLSETAAELGSMTPKKSYLALQKSLMGSSLRSCNFFFDAALIQARLATSNNFPNIQAAAFDTKYFQPKGWKVIRLEILKQWFKEGKTFDVAIQRDAPKGKAHGHIAIPVGLNAEGNVLVAEASYLTESNRIAAYSDNSLSSKFRIFVRTRD